MCIGHWILGIGDRHLGNSLVCIQTGKVLGIDFGHAFGTGTQLLGVPELVPFRLTPHIVSLMEPLGERGLFREVMVHCLRALRANTSCLLATMNVFIQEPSLDWVENADMFDGGLSDPGSGEWLPNQKIKQAKRKLEGTSSVSIMLEDVAANLRLKEVYMKAYSRLVASCTERASDGLTVEDQVDCLIEHASDYNLLGRMYSGWTAWI